MTIRILIDSCIWLDILQDARLEPVLAAIQELVQSNRIQLIVPEQVLIEFDRNKARVASQRKSTLKGVIKRFREALTQIDDGEHRQAAIDALHALDHKIALEPDTGERTIVSILDLMAKSPVIDTTSEIKVRAADRSLTRAAPCHQTKNSIGDAVVLETYVYALDDDRDPKTLFYFVTTNHTDFSEPAGNRKRPHPDLEQILAGGRSTYSTSIADVIREIDADMLEEFSLGDDYIAEPRKLSEILEAQHLLDRQVWYNRHWNLRHGVENGDIKVITLDEFKALDGYHPEVIVNKTWMGARRAAKRVERELGQENLGPWSDFEWGMINGKLSALRWVLGDDWDMLDT